jgi:hypothetical protein
MPIRLLVVFGLVLAAAVCARGQTAEEPKKLENTGAPLRAAFQCAEEDIRSSGLTCSVQHPCPVYLELAALGSSGTRLFLAGNLHTETTTLYSILLASEDAGKSWYEPFERVRGAALDQVQFLDLEIGWISGQHLGGFPRDPFLLVTRDGGKLWRATPVYEEGRAGSIESFRFDSKTHGWLWMEHTDSGESGDRYEVLESQTGGQSWMVRQTSEHAIAGRPRASTAASGYRLRPDAATKSYRVEKQTGERWQTVASFLVRVGECKEAEPSIPPESPPTEPSPEPVAPKKP